jgi:N-acetylmuramoyl-L-alanine amidase
MAKKGAIIDIGHGSDTFERTGGKGLYYNGETFEEHHANANVGKRLKKILLNHDIDVYFTQPPNEKEVPASERIAFAEKIGKQYGHENVVFISIHFNANSNENVKGACAFYWHTSEKAKTVAQMYAKNMRDNGHNLHGDGLHESFPSGWTNLWVCREIPFTSVLTENGFFTNPEELALIRSDKYCQEIAEINAKTVIEYLGVRYQTAMMPSDNKKYRLITGTWTVAAGIVNAKRRLRENGFGMLLYEIAEKEGHDGYQIIGPDFRLLTGTYTGANIAEAKAEEIRKAFGWNVYVIDA